MIFAFLRGWAGLFALAAAAAAFLRAFSSAFFRLRSARHAANFALTLPKPLGGSGCGRQLRLRVLEHREGDAQRTGLYGEHAVLPAQVCAEGAQQQQHQ